MIVISNLGDTNSILKEAVNNALVYYKLPTTCTGVNCGIPEDVYNGVVRQSLINAENTLKAQVITTKPIAISPTVILPVVTTSEAQKVTYREKPISGK